MTPTPTPRHRRVQPRARRRVATLGAAIALVAGSQAAAGPGTTTAAALGSSATAATQAESTTSERYIPAGWPNPENTGHSGTLKPMQGRTVTRNGAVIKNRVISGQMTIRADNVTLSNVFIKTGDYYGILNYGDNLRIEHSTVEGKAPYTLAGIAAINGGDFIARKVEVRGSEDGVRLGDDSILARSLIHKLAGDRSSHYDAVTADGHTGWRIRRNTILNQKGQTAAVWVGDSRYAPSAGKLRRNYLAGGGYTVYSGTGETRGKRKGIRITENVFSTRFFDRSGYYGVVYDWRKRGNTWSDNTWVDGPRRGRLVRP
ncbi:right-handed parallel beta-helix repeat-containing protein [Nocardioides donggukensis]|uniref:Right-handed parallel beta-helix repeat-containing protein n=1 Tax=Nocardioides donggukensis TaxID=2774019 RepID=A0A927K619_9ACTN|nr:hypothetical protein [Nocardioides donggukensis]MBD8870483.1 hypothetical protein [Nocardioides donggukensis]